MDRDVECFGCGLVIAAEAALYAEASTSARVWFPVPLCRECGKELSESFAVVDRCEGVLYVIRTSEARVMFVEQEG